MNVMWFSGRNCVGIVRVVDPYDGVKYYIGVGQGFDEAHDAAYIADWGAKFPKEVGDILFGQDAIRNGTAVPLPSSRDHAEAMVKIGMFYLENENG